MPLELKIWRDNMKIIYFDPRVTNEKSGLYSYYNGTYSELCNKIDVKTIRSPVNHINEVLNPSDKIDAIVFGLGWFAQESPSFFQKIGGLDSTGIPVICNFHKIANDTKSKLNFFEKNKVSTVLMSPGMVEKFKKMKPEVNFHLFPYAAHKESFYDRGKNRKYDLGFSGAKHDAAKTHGDGGTKKGFTKEKATLRRRMETLVENNLKDLEIFWNCSDAPGTLLPEKEYSELLSDSKIWLSTEGPAFEISPRYYEVILSKTLLVCNTVPKEYRHIFQDGKTCVEFKNDLSDFESKIRFYLENEEEREKIVKNAYEKIVEGHTWEKRADHLIELIREYNR